MTTRVLSFHAAYACGKSGACCSSGWPIPVEPPVERLLRSAEREGRLRIPLPVASALRAADGLPDGARRVLAADDAGRCAFFEPERGRLCAIHRQLGHEALPAACRHFPRLARVDGGAVSISLSHFCPTAAGLLFDKAPVAIVEDPPGFPPGRSYEGLDVTGALPPLLRPGVLMDAESHLRFEAHAVRTLAREDLAPESALATLAGQARALAAWTPGDGPLVEFLGRCLAGAAAPRWPAAPESEALWRAVAGAVPASLAAPVLPEGWRSADARWVEPGWAAGAPVVRRYLAARAFASWCAYQGDGLRTTVRALQAARSVLRIECARACQRAGRALDGELLKAAVRASDLLLVHLADSQTLARRLGRAAPP